MSEESKTEKGQRSDPLPLFRVRLSSFIFLFLLFYVVANDSLRLLELCHL